VAKATSRRDRRAGGDARAGARAPRAAATLLAAAFGTASLLLAAGGFEAAGKVKSSTYLPPEQLSGQGWKVAPEAENDGLFNTYTVTSSYGDFSAHGRVGVATRVKEVAALAELDRVSKTDVFTQAVKRSAVGSVETVKAFATKPVETITAVPSAVGRWLKKTKYQAGEVYSDVKGSGGSGSGEGDGKSAQAEEAAKKQALSYLKISAAERRWYQQLGVDPSTDNQVLRDVVKSYSRIEGLTSFGMRFAGLPSIPGARELRKTMDLVWTTDPWELRAANHKKLVGLGFAEADVKAFEDNPYLTLTQQTALVKGIEQLAGVKGREHLVARATGVDSRNEGADMTQSIVLLVMRHNKVGKLAEILPGVRLPLARATDGSLQAMAVADAAFWTEPIAAAAGELAQQFQGDPAKKRELWLVGQASQRFKDGMKAVGWTVHDRWKPPA
jgi:hypothetical protein